MELLFVVESGIYRIAEIGHSRNWAACWPRCTRSSPGHCHSMTNVGVLDALRGRGRSRCSRACVPRRSIWHSCYPCWNRRRNSGRFQYADAPDASERCRDCPWWVDHWWRPSGLGCPVCRAWKRCCRCHRDDRTPRRAGTSHSHPCT